MIKLKDLILEIDNITKPLIVYHGSDKKFNKFNPKYSTQGIIWFNSNKNKILNKEVGAQGHGYIYTVEVIINNPCGWNEYDRYMLDQLRSMGYDGCILPDKSGNFDCFVFSPNQIKIKNIEQIK